jgi:hypothetical protein
LSGTSLQDVGDWKTLTGSTGADTFPHMRGKGVGRRSKPHLFYLAFEILGFNRVENGVFCVEYRVEKIRRKKQSVSNLKTRPDNPV